ncbi:hypothetical protein F5144DRAFT_521596 [Chaetomium tenue]|uniref:Uncharacterized protein n=1 Tax=Chaetomium tenue TaxID=1854479 RepID=A0ACB7PKC1_9PEZI|nr:hypothetical protein F5144DRAFT_521596 [Chaetomium globosum]
MRLQIDISDAAVEENEDIHQLHLWGMQSSLWKTSCLICGKDTGPSRIRCNCGEGVPLKNRPSSNHRRIAIFQSDPPGLNLVWAEVKDSHLIIDDPTLDDFYGGSQTGSAWLDLAVINPAVENEPFHKLGHGLAMGFSSTMMDPEAVVEAKWRNRATTTISGPGYQAQWPGPLIFFCYGYPLSDYVKVDPTQSDDVEHGAEGKMSSLEIWTELDAMRYKGMVGEQESVEKQLLRQMGASRSVTPCAGPVWKWKVKEHGTSMRILDFTHKDLAVAIDYIALSQINPTPSRLQHWNLTNRVHAIQVQDLNHPGYGIKDLWNYVNPAIPFEFDNRPDSDLTLYLPKTSDFISFRRVALPLCTSAHPLLGAFAVGLPWLAHHSMEINPPFRRQIPLPTRWALLELLPTVSPTTGHPVRLDLHVPAPVCDSIAVLHADATMLSPHHVRALLKYLRHTNPREWQRRGPKGFETYWKLYARLEMKVGDNVPDVYAVRPGSNTTVALAGIDVLATVMAHLTLEGLENETPRRREEIVRARREMFDVMCGHREMAGH